MQLKWTRRNKALASQMPNYLSRRMRSDISEIDSTQYPLFFPDWIFLILLRCTQTVYFQMFGLYAFFTLLCIGYRISWSIVKDTLDTVFCTETNPLHHPLHDDRRGALDYWHKDRSRSSSYKSHDSRQHQNIIVHGNQMRPWGSFHPPPPFPGRRYPVMQFYRPKRYNAGRTPQKHVCDSVLL